MNKLEKIERDAQKAREKITAMQAILKQIEGQRTEQENLQIVQQVRALKLTRDELYSFLGSGTLPASLVAMIGGDAAIDTAAATEPETIFSRRGKQRNAAPEEKEGDTETANDDDESEGTDDEE